MLPRMAVPTFTVTCTRNERIARGVYDISLSKPASFSYKAGQFVLFRVPLLSDPTDIQPRAYSIASAPHEDELRFVIKLKEGGRASAWVEHLLRTGSTVDMQGPFGVFVVKPEDTRDLLFIATGTGIAPFRGHILEAMQHARPGRMDVVFGVREEADLFWQEEFAGLCTRWPGLQVHTTLSQPHEAWAGHRGRVQAIIPQVVDGIAERTVYICGNPDMTKQLKQAALEEWGVPKQHLHVEGFI